MRVIDEENLRENAQIVGNYLLEKCTELKSDYEIIGDIRGIGLFIGLELIRNEETREPATSEANWIVDRMKSVHKILISSDGPAENVLKLKPPMVFNKENVDEFLQGIKECLSHFHTVEVKYFCNHFYNKINNKKKKRNQKNILFFRKQHRQYVILQQTQLKKLLLI